MGGLQPAHLIVNVFFGFLLIAFIASMVMSWLPMISPSNPFRLFINRIIQPILAPLDRVIPPIGMFRLSFLFAFWGLLFAQQLFLAALPSNW